MSDQLVKDVRKIKKDLSHVWGTFFGRFGHLTPIQLRAIPHILAGEDALVLSRTASGKTEAVIAPLAELAWRQQWHGLAVVHICPTRALANDLLWRVSDQLKEVGLKCAIRTGDRKTFRAEDPPTFLITTIESLDSLLCREPKAFANIRAVVLDELHLVDGTYRGDQLRLLLRRLDSVSGIGRPRRYALSATVSAPRAVCERYMPEAAIIADPGQRELSAAILRSLDEVVTLAQQERRYKLIAFANSRRMVEETAALLGIYYPKNLIATHHSSLSKRTREEVETFLRTSRYGICVATSSLEVGIDIGDVDAIVLLEPPWSVSSFLQRIGRGNRRTGTVRVLCVANSEQEIDIYHHMIKAAREGDLQTEEYRPDYSVVVQQTFSILFSRPSGVDIGHLRGLFQNFVSDDALLRILSHLQTGGWLVGSQPRFRADTRVMNLGERGLLHSNIPDGDGHQVIDATTGRLVGHVQCDIDPIFALAGRVWRVRSIVGAKVYAEPYQGRIATANFPRHRPRGRFWDLLPPDFQAV